MRHSLRSPVYYVDRDENAVQSSNQANAAGDSSSMRNVGNSSSGTPLKPRMSPVKGPRPINAATAAAAAAAASGTQTFKQQQQQQNPISSVVSLGSSTSVPTSASKRSMQSSAMVSAGVAPSSTPQIQQTQPTTAASVPPSSSSRQQKPPFLTPQSLLPPPISSNTQTTTDSSSSFSSPSPSPSNPNYLPVNMSISSNLGSNNVSSASLATSTVGSLNTARSHDSSSAQQSPMVQTPELNPPAQQQSPAPQSPVHQYPVHQSPVHQSPVLQPTTQPSSIQQFPPTLQPPQQQPFQQRSPTLQSPAQFSPSLQSPTQLSPVQLSSTGPGSPVHPGSPLLSQGSTVGADGPDTLHQTQPQQQTPHQNHIKRKQVKRKPISNTVLPPPTLSPVDNNNNLTVNTSTNHDANESGGSIHSNSSGGGLQLPSDRSRSRTPSPSRDSQTSSGRQWEPFKMGSYDEPQKEAMHETQQQSTRQNLEPMQTSLPQDIGGDPYASQGGYGAEPNHGLHVTPPQTFSSSSVESSQQQQQQQQQQQKASKRASVLYLDTKSSIPNFSTPRAYRHSIQIPAQGGGNGGFYDSLNAKYSEQPQQQNHQNPQQFNQQQQQQPHQPHQPHQSHQSHQQQQQPNQHFNQQNQQNKYNQQQQFNQQNQKNQKNQQFNQQFNQQQFNRSPNQQFNQQQQQQPQQYNQPQSPTSFIQNSYGQVTSPQLSYGSEHTHRNSVATGMPDSQEAGFGPSSSRKWKYHIQKNFKDLYLTTNPDTKYYLAPRAPSYYVEITEDVTFNNATGQFAFTLMLVNAVKGMCEVMVTRRFRENTDDDFFEIVVYRDANEPSDRHDEFDFSGMPQAHHEISGGSSGDGETNLQNLKSVDLGNNNGGGPVCVESWRCNAMPVVGADAGSLLESRSRSNSVVMGENGGGFGGSRTAIRQYTLLDQRGRRWVVGNRADHMDINSLGVEEEAEEQEAELIPIDGSGSGSNGGFSGFGSGGGQTMAFFRRSTRVYFFAPGSGGPETDKIMAVLQRRKQVHKQLAKDLGKLAIKTGHTISEKIEGVLDGANNNNNNNGGTGGGGESTSHKAFLRNKLSGLSSRLSGHGQSNSVSTTGNYSNQTYAGSQNVVSSSSQPRPTPGIMFNDAAPNPLNVADDESQDKFGWLTVFESAKHRAGMWSVVVASTLAVAYAQRTDRKERSLQQRMRNIGRKYRDARLQVHYGQGHRYTRSSV
ncbi:uncharacterized protein SAPINGB_P005511 [Magnusiomyces paraingens]|uniref:Uncharacterized protein n=1 Tax=Magnusiomyces paraingens TaxID=2606893 RepID=A0A5E8C029_9ASCO|nr:uncharacterized protein SAPINGB_P005511 [Saprochaete ingens]VVT57054.1 unnamed protein product [Saprochaete ingens]